MYLLIFKFLLSLIPFQNRTEHMYSIRIISLATVLLGSLLVNAAPLPAVSAHHVKPGSVFTAKPAHFQPPLVSVHSLLEPEESLTKLPLTSLGIHPLKGPHQVTQ